MNSEEAKQNLLRLLTERESAWSTLGDKIMRSQEIGHAIDLLIEARIRDVRAETRARDYCIPTSRGLIVDETPLPGNRVRVQITSPNPVSGEELQNAIDALRNWLDKQSYDNTGALYNAAMKLFKRSWVDPDGD